MKSYSVRWMDCLELSVAVAASKKRMEGKGKA
jgi:hypothetical protein